MESKGKFPEYYAVPKGWYAISATKPPYSHLADIEEQAQELFSRLVKKHAEKESITEQLKVTDQMKWVQKMNNIRERVTETVYSDMVFV